MNNKDLLKYLNFFSENKVDLSDEESREKIDNIFGWNVFLKNIESLENENLIH
jgi:hypothetical protein